MRTLTWVDLKRLGKSDNANRWYPTDAIVEEYIAKNGYRSPSRQWPQSYARPVMTKKFAKWAEENHPEFSKRFN